MLLKPTFTYSTAQTATHLQEVKFIISNTASLQNNKERLVTLLRFDNISKLKLLHKL